MHAAKGTRTYSIGHLRPQGLVLDIIALGDNVVVARDDAAGLIKFALGVERPGRRHAPEDVGVAANYLVGADANERACAIGQHQ